MTALSDRKAAGRHHFVGDHAHQADPAAAVHEREARIDERAAECARSLIHI